MQERVTFGGVELQEQASLPRRFLEGDAGQGARHRSAADLDKVWARERRKREVRPVINMHTLVR